MEDSSTHHIVYKRNSDEMDHNSDFGKFDQNEKISCKMKVHTKRTGFLNIFLQQLYISLWQRQ